MAETTLATGACNSAEPERPNLATYSIRHECAPHLTSAAGPMAAPASTWPSCTEKNGMARMASTAVPASR